MTVGGQTSALDALYRAHAPAVFRRARRILGSAPDADEVVQEIFVSLLDRPAQISGEASRAAWFYVTTTNKCLNRLRDHKNRDRLLLNQTVAEPASAPARDDVLAMRQALARLPEELARVAIYYYGDEMTHQEIADVLGCSRRHVGDLLVRLEEALVSSEARK